MLQANSLRGGAFGICFATPPKPLGVPTLSAPPCLGPTRHTLAQAPFSGGIVWRLFRTRLSCRNWAYTLQPDFVGSHSTWTRYSAHDKHVYVPVYMCRNSTSPKANVPFHSSVSGCLSDGEKFCCESMCFRQSEVAFALQSQIQVASFQIAVSRSLARNSYKLSWAVAWHNYSPS